MPSEAELRERPKPQPEPTPAQKAAQTKAANAGKRKETIAARAARAAGRVLPGRSDESKPKPGVASGGPKPAKPVARALSDEEVRKMRPQIIGAIKVTFWFFDEAIRASEASHSAGRNIWQKTTDAQYGDLADWWLDRAKTDKTAAKAARGAYLIQKQIGPLEILAPKVAETIAVYVTEGIGVRP